MRRLIADRNTYAFFSPAARTLSATSDGSRGEIVRLPFQFGTTNANVEKGSPDR